MHNFLLGGYGEGGKISWVRWEEVCKPKECGGLGIKDLCAFNMALLGKWWWRFLTEPESLWCKVIKAKAMYFPASCEFPWWRDIKAACYLNGVNWLQAGLVKSLGRGDATQFWSENWVGSGFECIFPGYIVSLNKNMTWCIIWGRGMVALGLGIFGGEGHYEVGSYIGCRICRG